MKKIDWLESFAEEQLKKQGMKKTASLNKVAEQIIVDCGDYPEAKVGSMVDYQNAKYKVIDTEYEDMEGPGIVLEKVAEEDCENCEACGDIEKNAGLEELPAEDVIAEEELPVETPVAEIPVEPVAKVAPSMDITAPGQKKLNDPPYHPTGNPGNSDNIEVVENFQQIADETAAEIERENAIDRTIVENHYTWNQNQIIDQMVTDLTGLTAPAEEAPAEATEDEELPMVE